ncbi:MAG: hypothetical protein V7676_18730, partial [Parasphingorhabdus sp.]|uniref:hypothetical protein n=1 Tax=Parasphingorhabdus sp. TaxID=2709688 RepID=UPI003001CCB0
HGDNLGLRSQFARNVIKNPCKAQRAGGWPRGEGRLGAWGRMSSNGRMIQSTTRLSRGARLRRSRPVWIYGATVLAVVVLLGLGLLVFRP